MDRKPRRPADPSSSSSSSFSFSSSSSARRMGAQSSPSVKPTPWAASAAGSAEPSSRTSFVFSARHKPATRLNVTHIPTPRSPAPRPPLRALEEGTNMMGTFHLRDGQLQDPSMFPFCMPVMAPTAQPPFRNQRRSASRASSVSSNTTTGSRQWSSGNTVTASSSEECLNPEVLPKESRRRRRRDTRPPDEGMQNDAPPPRVTAVQGTSENGESRREAARFSQTQLLSPRTVPYGEEWGRVCHDFGAIFG